MPREPHRRLRRAGALAVAFVIGLAAVVGLVIFINSRDSAGIDSAAKGPGQAFPDLGHAHLGPGQATRIRYNSDPPTSGPHLPAAVRRDGGPLDDDQLLQALETGNVVLVYSKRSFEPALKRIADDVAGPFDAGVAAAGQAVILDRDPARHPRGVTAVAWRHLERVASPTDPALRAFADFWLGRGAPGG